MKYALLVYNSDSSWDERPSAEKRELHNPSAYQANDTGAAALLAHYRTHAPALTTTIRMAENEVTRTQGPLAGREALRALFLLESDDAETVLDLAARLPAVRIGCSIEVWPLIEPNPHARDRHTAAHKHRDRGA
jgi:hypothetical protein